jgi:hypothetical protein
MVKIREDWLTVEDGTQLYTKTWEVSQYNFRLFGRISYVAGILAKIPYGFLLSGALYMTVHKIQSLL